MSEAEFDADEIVDFWLDEKQQGLWFRSTPEFDQLLQDKFLSAVDAAQAGQLDTWRNTPRGTLALILLLDQFPLNIFRGQARGYLCGDIALSHAKYALDNDYLKHYKATELMFVLMPFMHSENMDDQNLSVNLFEKFGLSENAKFARHHRDIVAQFGRFPHRNQALGRESSAEEISYLDSDQAFKG